MPWAAVAGAVAGGVVNHALAPSPPDYAGAAAQQGQDNIYASQVANWQNRVNTTTPYGSQSFSATPNASSPGGYDYSSNVSFSPQQQALYDQQYGMQTQAGNAASAALGQYMPYAGQAFNPGQAPQGQTLGAPGQLGIDPRLQGPDGQLWYEQFRTEMGQGPQFQNMGHGPTYGMVGSSGPYDMADMGAMSPGDGSLDRFYGQMPQQDLSLYGKDYGAQRDEVEQAYMRRQQRLLDPSMSQAGDALQSRLKNMGLTEGTAAYDRELQNLRQSQDQTRADWADRAILAGGDEQSRITNLALGADAQRFGQQQNIFTDQYNQAGFNNNAKQGEFNNRQTGIQSLLAALNQRNSARAQQSSDERSNIGFNNQSLATSFGDEQAVTKFNNQNAQQEFQNEGTTAGFNNDARNAEYQRYLQGLTTQQGLNAQRLGTNQSLQQGQASFNNNVNNTDWQNRMQLAMMQRQVPLQEYNSLRTGVNPTLPQFQGYGQAGVNAPPTFSGAQAQGNAQQIGYGQQMGMMQQGLNLGANSNWNNFSMPSWMQNTFAPSAQNYGQGYSYSPAMLDDYFYGGGYGS